MLVNPRKRRKSKKRKAPRSRARTIVKYRTRKAKRRIRRRNPIKLRGIQANVFNAAKNGAIGSVGAIAGTVVGNLLPIPENFKAGNMGLIINALIGIGTGMMVGNFTNRKVGEHMAQGAVTVALHETMKNVIQQAVPALNLDGYDNGLLGDDLLAYDDGMSAYDASNYDDGLNYSGAGMTNPLEDGLDYDDDDDLNLF